VINEKLAELKEAIRLSRLAESTAAYWDGLNGTREESEAAFNHALKLVDEVAEELKRTQPGVQIGNHNVQTNVF
jgi:hypothetical protein